MATDEPITGGLLTLPEAAKTLPRRVHASTLWRWATRGIKGVKLQLTTIGGRRFLSPEALQEFLNGVRAVEQSGAAHRSSRTRESLAAAGLLGPKKRGRKSRPKATAGAR